MIEINMHDMKGLWYTHSAARYEAYIASHESCITIEEGKQWINV